MLISFTLPSVTMLCQNAAKKEQYRWLQHCNRTLIKFAKQRSGHTMIELAHKPDSQSSALFLLFINYLVHAKLLFFKQSDLYQRIDRACSQAKLVSAAPQCGNPCVDIILRPFWCIIIRQFLCYQCIVRWPVYRLCLGIKLYKAN